MTKRRIRHIDEWTTIAVTALPSGWRNVFKVEDGTTIEAPCPATLLQELRATMRYEDLPQSDGTMRVQSDEQHHDPPYETRVVFADWDVGELGPVLELDNYLHTLPPGATP